MFIQQTSRTLSRLIRDSIPLPEWVTDFTKLLKCSGIIQKWKEYCSTDRSYRTKDNINKHTHWSRWSRRYHGRAGTHARTFENFRSRAARAYGQRRYSRTLMNAIRPYGHQKPSTCRSRQVSGEPDRKNTQSLPNVVQYIWKVCIMIYARQC